MAEPVGIIGTAVGIVSLGLQVYGSLKSYLDDFKYRDEHVAKVSLYLDRLQGSLNIIQRALPALQNDVHAEIDAVVPCLQACETSLRTLNAALQEHSSTPGIDFKGKAKEVKKKIKYPFAVPELEKLVRDLDRINNLLLVALQGLGLSIQSTNSSKLADINDTTRTTATDVMSILGKIDTIGTSHAALQAGLNNNQTSTESLLRQIQGMSVSKTTETMEAFSRIQNIEKSTSSAASNLEDLISGHQIHQQHTIRIEERILELKDLLVQSKQKSPAEQFYQMLMSKPAFLRSWQDEMADSEAEIRGTPAPTRDSKANPSLTRQGQTSYGCGCRHRRRQTRTYSPRSVFTFFDESMIETIHERGCVKYQGQQTTRERVVGIAYTGLHRFLNIAVAASFHHVRGAGGASISPMFRYYAMVDRKRSPAFRIIEIMAMVTRWEFYAESGRGPPLDNDVCYRQIMDFGIFKLRRIFADETSSPMDVDETGATLLAGLFPRATGAIGMDIQTLKRFHDVLRSLLKFDIPRESNASHRRTSSSLILAAVSFLPQQRDSYFIRELAPLLFNDDPSCQTLPQAGVHWRSPTFRRLMFESRQMAEALGLDSPLFASLLKKDEQSLLQALESQFEDPKSPASNGITAIHLAISWPKGLEIILKAIPDIDLNMESNRVTPLELALYINGDTCVASSSLCSGCSCAEAVELLLKFGSHLDRRHVGRCFSLHGCSLKAFQVMLVHIKYWRGELTKLARHNLSEAERDQFEAGDDSSVWDSVAPTVIGQLEAKRVSPFGTLQIHPGDYRLSPAFSSPKQRSIYHVITSFYAAEIAFQLGFRDINVSDNGETPFVQMASHRTASGMAVYEYYKWLIDYGANYKELC